MDRRIILSPESAEASDIFDKFCTANTLKAIIFHYRQLCRLLRIKPRHFPDFYPRLKEKLCSWRAQGLWTKIEKRASANCYGRARVCASTRVLIIGGGPCGLRAAIEAQFLGAKVVLIEKRDRFSRNNVLHLWPFVITDLKGLGAKKFYGKFCAGSIDHISIRQLQCLLLKVALLIGVEVHEGVGFEGLVEPTETEGWKALTSPADHPVSQYDFDCLIGADGRRNTLEGFRRKALRAKLAIAITANFINKRSEGEARVKEISGVSYIFNQKFFQDLNEAMGIDLENIVYYKDETHYFVMTAKKQSLLAKGVLLKDHADTAKLLSYDNISRDNLMIYAVEAALFSTDNQLTDLEFAVNHYGQPDVAMFDFTAMYAAENASRVLQHKGRKLLMTLVGDSLLEPFWPTGSGCARGFLSSFDACWMLRSWAIGSKSILEVIAERESIYRLLGQTTPENLNKEHSAYTLDPHSRYPNLNVRAVLPFQVKGLLDTDDQDRDAAVDEQDMQRIESSRNQAPDPKKRRDLVLASDDLLEWLRGQVSCFGIQIQDLYDVFMRGDVLSALVYRFRPDLIHSAHIPQENVDPMAILETGAVRNQIAFDFLYTEYGIMPILSGVESVDPDCLDFLSLLPYVSEIYEVFKGEIPQINSKDRAEEIQDPPSLHEPRKGPGFVLKHGAGTRTARRSSRLSSQRSGSGESEILTDSLSKRHRKRRSDERSSRSNAEERERRRAVMELNRVEREKRRMRNLIHQRERFLRSMHLLQLNGDGRVEAEKHEDYTIHLYRRTAPEWKERCNMLEQKLFHGSVKEERTNASLTMADLDKNVPGLARHLEEKLRGSTVDKKPKELLRAIGKIEKTDWNVQLIERKIAESKVGGKGRKEWDDKVPKWSRQAFDDKREAMKRRMEGKEKGVEDALFEETMKNLGRRIKEGNALETGQRGANKVSQMAGQIVSKFHKEIKETKDGPSSRVVMTQGRPLFEPKNPAAETCHFCSQRVYVVERMMAEGKFFHRNCFRCEYCNTSLRLGTYSFEREGRYGDRFYCTPHFQYIRHFGWKKYDELEELQDQRRNLDSECVASGDGSDGRREEQLLVDMEERGTTPERVEFENLADFASEEEVLSEMDEDEWTDRNFGASHDESNTSDEASDLSEDEDEVTPEGIKAEDRRDDGEKSGDESDSDTEVASGETSSEAPSEEEEDHDEECGGSTTEIETDSEFAEDPPQTVPGKVPTIVVEEPEQLMTRFFDIYPKASPLHKCLPQNENREVRTDDLEMYDELILVEPTPKVIPKETRALPRVVAVPRKWEPLVDENALPGKKTLQLKTMYLHGAILPPTGTNPRKVDQATHNQFTSVLDMISEQQKRLQPAPKPSPAMQAFLEGTDKLKNQNSRFPLPRNYNATSPKANQLPPWEEKGDAQTQGADTVILAQKIDDVQQEPSAVNPISKKWQAEKEIPALTRCELECSEVQFQTSESTESQSTIVDAKQDSESDSCNSSDADLTVSDLEDELILGEKISQPPPRLEFEDEFGISLGNAEIEEDKVICALSSSDSKDSLNSALFLETQISSLTDDDNLQNRRLCRKGLLAQEEEYLGLDLENLDFMDVDELSSPEDFVQTLSRKKGYSRLLDENGQSPTVEECSFSSITTTSSESRTPILPVANSNNELSSPEGYESNLEHDNKLSSTHEHKNGADSLEHSKTLNGSFPKHVPPEQSNYSCATHFVEPVSSNPLPSQSDSKSTTARKLDELSKERAKESELIRLLVLGKIKKNGRCSTTVSPPSPHDPLKGTSALTSPTGIRRQSQPLLSFNNHMSISISNPPTPINPPESTLPPTTPPYGWNEPPQKDARAYYGSLPNIALLNFDGKFKLAGGETREEGREDEIHGGGPSSPRNWNENYLAEKRNRERAREAARERARLKSDLELGLSPTTFPYLQNKLLRRQLSQPEGQEYRIPQLAQAETEKCSTFVRGSFEKLTALTHNHNADISRSSKRVIPVTSGLSPTRRKYDNRRSFSFNH